MKKKSYLWGSFLLVFLFIFSFTMDAHATNGSDVQSLQQAMGIQPDGDYAKADLATTPEGNVIMATVEDPSKIGGCLKGDRVKLINLGNGEWKITRLANGSGFQFIAQKEDGVMKITKTETFGEKVSKSIYDKGLAGKSAFGARVSYITYSKDDYVVYGVTVDVEPDDAVGFGINYTYFVHNNFSFELSADYVKTDLELSALGLSANAGEVTQIPVLFTGRVHLGSDPKVKPYLAAGVGYFFNDFDSDRNTVEFIYGRGAEIYVDDSFGFLVGGGVEFFVSEKAALNLDLKYIWTEVEANVNKPGFTKVDFEPNPLVIGLGIKYYF